jgi:hypothetical protein
MITLEQLDKLIIIVKNSPMYEGHVKEEIMQALTKQREYELLNYIIYEVDEEEK